MKNLFPTILILSAFVFSCQEQDGMKHDMHKEDHIDHMDHMDHSGKHSSAPIGVVGNMHHMGWMLGIEVLFPLIQEKYNLQMDTKYQIVVGYKKSF